MSELAEATSTSRPKPVSLGSVSWLLLGSGFCALVYQTVWFRAFRLIFGASTASTAAVLALFMAGLGIGSVILGPRVDRSRRPLGFYANLELAIAALAAMSPLLVPLIYRIYGALGGNLALGMVGGTLVRLALAAPIVALPAILMGGTLPAAARAIEAGLGRRRTGWIYGFNTLGAVAGVLAATFWSLEHLGMARTCLVAALLNVLIAMVARRLARERDELPVDAAVGGDIQGSSAVPVFERRVILGVAAFSGFAFFLLELVWYRILAPILGGSTYTFGLILALALLGIGIGGLVFGAGTDGRRRTLAGLATTLVLEGLVVLAPWAAGDHLALLALSLRSFGAGGFGQTVVSWALLAGLVVLPAAIIAGYQFPLLLAVLGQGTTNVGRDVGHAYGWNTAGAIVGSLAGGFGLLPLLGATRLWLGTGIALVVLGVAATIFGAQRGRAPVLRWNFAVAAIALACVFAQGPTTAWRHSGIGAGRFVGEVSSPNATRRSLQANRSAIVWEADGVESSVALHGAAGYAFFVNGKSDGHTIGDAPTQVLSGLLGALLVDHPVQHALVIGLGTGSTAGWLGALPSIERVDVVELEPAILEVARASSPVNHQALDNPRISVTLGDAREVLMTTDRRYDVIFSEPSNPYRAGIASLFSLEFYRAVEQRLADGGVLVQWLQGYEVDAEAVRIAYRTLSEVFPTIETWQVSRQDLLLVATRRPITYDLGRIAAILEQEPYASAMAWTWGVAGVEGLFTGFLGDQRLAAAIDPHQSSPVNTDDRSVLEFGFARSLGRSGLFSPLDLRSLVIRLPWDPAREGPGGAPFGLDTPVMNELLVSRLMFEGSEAIFPSPSFEPDVVARHRARELYRDGDLGGALAAWQSQDTPPMSLWDLLLVTEGLASVGDEGARAGITALREHRGIEASLLEARLLLAQGDPTGSLKSWQEAVSALRLLPWLQPAIGVRQLLELPLDLAGEDPALGRVAFEELGTPFAVSAFDEARQLIRLRLAVKGDFDAMCLDAIRDLEPQVPWARHILELRVRCYERSDNPSMLARASADLEDFLANEPLSIEASAGRGNAPHGRD